MKAAKKRSTAKAYDRNPLIDVDDPKVTANNIACALNFIRCADAHISGVSEIGSDASEGRGLLLKCAEDAAASIAEEAIRG